MRAASAALLAVAALAGCGGGDDPPSDERTDGGPLVGEREQYATSLFVEPGKVQPMGWAVIKNTAGEDATVERVTLDRPSKGLELVGVYALPGREQVGDDPGRVTWPPRGGRRLPADGLTVRPARDRRSSSPLDPNAVNLVLGLRPARSGDLRTHGVVVDYRVGDRAFRRRLRIGYTMCARAPRGDETCRAALPDHS